MTRDMWALTFDRRRETWDTSTGMVRERIPVPSLNEAADPHDGSSVLIKVHYAGFCGSDRGIWWRKSFGDMILGSLDTDGADRRTFGHELLGEIVEVGSRVTAKYGYVPGQIVTTESHIVCGTCVQCKLGESHVCANDRIIGISTDGCFAEYVKLPAKSLWPTDVEKIRPEVAAIQEPFGNAVHACQVADLRGRSVAILGTGTIGLFAVLIARAMGARTVIGVDVDPHHRELAARLGCDVVLTPNAPPADAPWRSDPALREAVLDLTDGVGVDVAMEMAGHPSSTNNAIRMARRGGHVVLFGVRNGDAVFEDAHRIVMNGLQLHGVVGRRIWDTWHRVRGLLEARENGIQDAIWTHILDEGRDTLVDIRDFDRASFEGVIQRHPKAILRFNPPS
jgi:threonine 3-dehydrogenase